MKRDSMIVAGLLLVSYGGWLAWPPLAAIGPGLVLLWFALPPRPPFIKS